MTLALSRQAPSGWDQRIASAGAFFLDRCWHAHLARCLRGDTLYLADAGNDDVSAVQIFRRGPFRMAYLNFPVGGTLRAASPAPPVLAALRAGLKRYGVQRLRIRCSPFRDGPALTGAATEEPETAIVNLPALDLDALPKVRRDLNRVARFGLEIGPAVPADAPAIFASYLETLRRNDGARRYPAQYFSALLELAAASDRVLALAARREGSLLGYLVAVFDGEIAYYLHGGAAGAGRKLGASDALVNAAIDVSRRRGIGCFNLMTSPPGQPSLVRYKEKWGAQTRTHRTYDLAVSRVGDALLRAAERAQAAARRRHA